VGSSPFAGTINALAGQFAGAVSPFPDTPQFAAFKQAPRMAGAATQAVATPQPSRRPLAAAYSGMGDGRQPYSGATGQAGATRQPFASIGGPPQTGAQQAGQTWSGGGMAGATGYGALDQHNNEFNKAMAAFGTPANILKAMVNRESSGDWARDGARVVNLRGDQILPFVGIFRKTAESWGLDFDAMIGNKQLQIDGMAKIVSGLSQQYGGFDNAIKVYFGGEQALNGSFVDENGLDSNYYYGQVKKNWSEWDRAGGADGLPTQRWGSTGLENNSVVAEAMKFVGTPYVWGGIPGADDDPRVTGWDCSGMTYWLDQKYGGGQLPMGSHYQYQYAQQSGRLFTDLSQLQSGDLVFIDTGWQGGAGAELNRAGHVAVYIGNGQILHAANQQAGTIVSQLSAYGNVLGGMKQSFSGGLGGGMQSSNPYRVRSAW
jgi:hypothetical protein